LDRSVVQAHSQPMQVSEETLKETSKSNLGAQALLQLKITRLMKKGLTHYKKRFIDVTIVVQGETVEMLTLRPELVTVV
jgi:hypothetical protein